MIGISNIDKSPEDKTFYPMNKSSNEVAGDTKMWILNGISTEKTYT